MVRVVPCLGLALCLACPGPPGADAGAADAAGPRPDAGAPDAGAPDAGTPDAGAPDAGGPDAGGPCPACWRSSLYPDNWTPALTDDEGRFLHDFSYAGYRRSEAPLPDVTGPVFAVTGADPLGTADATLAIQDAIDDAAAAGGGVVLLGPGLYRVEGRLTVSSSHTVLRGAGPDQTRVYFTQTANMAGQSHLRFGAAQTYGGARPLAADAAPRQGFVEVADVADLSVGDEVTLGHVITPGFIARHGMTGTWVAFVDQTKHIYRRVIVALDDTVTPARVTLDVPLRDELRTDEQAQLFVVSGGLAEVGLEDLALSNATADDVAWSLDRVHAVRFENVRDGWIKNVHSFASPAGEDGMHLQSSGVYVLDSHRVTVADSVLAYAQNRGGGGNGYLFEVSRSNEVLFVDDVGRAGRHNFIQNWDFGTSGVVWLRCASHAGRSLIAQWDPIGTVGTSEFHHSLATANLIDQSFADDGWAALNRQDYSSGAGHSAHENVFWNLTGGVLESYQYGHGYVIGTLDVNVQADLGGFDLTGKKQGTEPADFVEGEGQGPSLWPASLFEDQLARRLAGD